LEFPPILVNISRYIRNGLPKDAEVRSVAIPDVPIDAAGIVVYPVTLEHGVYKSRPLTSSVIESQNQSDLEIEFTTPNPARSFIHIQYHSNKIQPIEISIVDCLGQVVFSEKLGYCQLGHNNISINDLNLASGFYFLILKSNTNFAQTKFIVSQ
jgi:hypothetical protein